MIETKVTWRGKASLPEVEAALHRCGRAEIRLPAEHHHALWRCLGEGGPGAPELLDVEGGAELLQQIARIGALAELAQLGTVLGDAPAEVRVVSPSPVIYIDLTPKADSEPEPG